MNKIIVASYMGSGSSAVTDLLSEYANASCPNGSFEYVFMHCPNGLFDLEDKLLVGNNALRSDEALRSFEQTMRGLYENEHWWFGGYRTKISTRFMDYVEDLLSELTTTSFGGFWYEQEKLSKGQWNINRVKKKLGANHYDLLATQLRMAYPKPDEFYAAARLFLKKTLSDIAGETEDKTAVLDQLLLPHNIWRAHHYFDESNTRIIVVSRDPRDVYTTNKYLYSKWGLELPIPLDASEYCTYYKQMREAERLCESGMVLRIQFEDLVLHYDETVSAIERFIGQSMLGDHIDKMKHFDPSVSKKNIGIFSFSPESQHEASIIKNELGAYLYPIETLALDPVEIERAF